MAHDQRVAAEVSPPALASFLPASPILVAIPRGGSS
jgi:hypothetical protein